MRIGTLLEELIGIAKTPKTDFALNLNMTPSGLSKILTGQRIPAQKERKQFTRQTANYFAEAIYARGCYLKFKNLFPVLYDFKNIEELCAFLTCAIEYALDQDFLLDNNVNLNYSERGIYYWSEKTVLNMLCTILSDCILTSDGAPLEFFSTLPLLNPVFTSIFQRIKISELVEHKNVTLNHLFEDSLLSSTKKKNGGDILTFIMLTQRYLDLRFWKINSPIDQNFLLLKGRLLILFSTQIDGTPMIVPFHHKGYLTVFYNALMEKDITLTSYSKEQAVSFLQQNPLLVTQQLEKGIDSVFSFVPIGYLLNEAELNALSDSNISKAISDIFVHVLKSDTIFTVSETTMERFVSTGRVIAPLLGVSDIPAENRSTYLKRLNSYVNCGFERIERIKLINSELSNLVILCTKEFSLIYTIDNKYQREKIHLFRTDQIALVLLERINSNHKQSISLSPELWEAYQEQLVIDEPFIKHFTV